MNHLLSLQNVTTRTLLWHRDVISSFSCACWVPVCVCVWLDYNFGRGINVVVLLRHLKIWSWLKCVEVWLRKIPEKFMNELVPPTQGLRVDQLVPNSHIWHNDYPTMNLNHMNHVHARTILTLLPGDKMPAISRAISMHFQVWKLLYFDSNLRKFVPESPVDNKPALVRVMAWRRLGDKTLSEPMLTQFADIYAAPGGDEF